MEDQLVILDFLVNHNSLSILKKLLFLRTHLNQNRHHSVDGQLELELELN